MSIVGWQSGDKTSSVALVAERLADYSIGFVVPSLEHQTADGMLAGSGSLVSIDGVEGVLTAKHVVHALKKRESAGIILCGYRRGEVHQLVFTPQLCRYFSFGTKADDPATGPDLLFLVLPPDTTAILKARKSFYNISKRRDSMLNSPPSRDLGVWAISGMADEWTADAPTQMGFKRIKVFHGRLLGPLEWIEWRSSGGFDYMVFKAVYNDGYGGPQSFAGYSGGGIWQLLIKPVDGVPAVTDRMLMGVAFYQSNKEIRSGEATREVVCHGRDSVYQLLVDKLRANTAF